MMPVWALGLMTGTVLDGNIDIALIRTDGEEVAEFGEWTLAPYADEMRPLLAKALAAGRDWQFEGPEPAIFREAEEALTRAQSAAVTAFLAKARLKPADLAVIGFHGQTVLHRAPAHGVTGATRQLGDGELMARLVGVDVAYDFRSADIHAGGQGAPLAPTYHVALLRRLGAAANSAVLNLGGVANVTWWGGGDRIVGFDTGPANAPLNDWMKRHGLGEMDRDGSLALSGTVDEARLDRLLQHPYLSAVYPKSLDRFDFTAAMADGLSPRDGAATLTAFTAAAVGRGLDLLPVRPEKLIVCGGGRRNRALIAAIRKRARVEPATAEEVGWRGDAVEAECFAYLAMRVRRGLPISFPQTTGVERPMTGGRLARPAGRG
ncbi:anhydro-N-acetylmuramic acid kinase [Rhizobiales bacterium GAS191]|nr:anhydro-N-acetylmuramic acid kinase [Rhizobiales bacterium GAS113]SEC62258.1 anhydro-N-acetylmuramic acid kinase [Rhizobiales bacterium GAS191]